MLSVFFSLAFVSSSYPWCSCFSLFFFRALVLVFSVLVFVPTSWLFFCFGARLSRPGVRPDFVFFFFSLAPSVFSSSAFVSSSGLRALVLVFSVLAFVPTSWLFSLFGAFRSSQPWRSSRLRGFVFVLLALPGARARPVVLGPGSGLPGLFVRLACIQHVVSGTLHRRSRLRGRARGHDGGGACSGFGSGAPRHRQGLTGVNRWLTCTP